MCLLRMRFQGSYLAWLAPALARDALPRMARIGHRHRPARRTELSRIRQRLSNHSLGEHRSQRERVAVEDAVMERHPRPPDADGGVVDEAIGVLIDLAAQPVQGAKLARLVEEMRVHPGKGTRAGMGAGRLRAPGSEAALTS